MTLQIVIYFERIYTVLFFLAECVMYAIKANYLVYPPGNLETEIIGLFFLLIIQLIKINNANKANKAEMIWNHVYTILLSFPVIIAYLFYFRHQIYILWFDAILCIIGMLFAFFEAIFAIVASASVPSRSEDNN